MKILIALASAIVLALSSSVGFALTAESVNTAEFREMPARSGKNVARPDPLIVAAQVLLSRRSISPGEIDGLDGKNFRKALAQFRRGNGPGDGDDLDQRTWVALTAGSNGGIVVSYTLSRKDVSARFVRSIPRDYARQARLRRLAYTNPLEMLAERFHMSEGLLNELNPKAKFRKIGERIVVVSVDRAPAYVAAERIEANKTTGMVSVYGPGDLVLASYPATIGSDDTPSPTGEYTVERIVKNPTYHYDPQKNFQQGRNKRKLVLPRGPNNPVGTVWIALSKPTFGIHGTPEPSKVSKTSSHGCVRLTNWDVEELAALARKGLPVRFVE
ncbi:L,D-transpeptidase [Ancylobacter sp. Lp-2]|uniref:L,D-transpeptidase n=1 Tax=Ancylobacter sp. Lp-2 TaxID=2881339 RepID=UPI001E42C9A3|nr:L,D-transpeptidase [Ancylobacter sp. Lp-2]MCB4771378.1 L,D-transpeptidase [Ancylobacter sp. Lp-2]